MANKTIDSLFPTMSEEEKIKVETKIFDVDPKKFFLKTLNNLAAEEASNEQKTDTKSPVQEPEKKEQPVQNCGNRRKITMLCPCCQHTEEYYLSIAPAAKYQKKPLVAVALDCPICGDVPMYRADKSLLEALKLLNGAGIWTEYHCSECHTDHSKEYNVLGLPKYFSGPYIMVSHLMDHEEESLIKMANKFNKSPEAFTQDLLIDVEIHKDTTFHSATDHETVDRHQVIIYCYMKDPSLLHSYQCCRAMTSFVRSWLQDMNNGIIPTDRGALLRNAANESWFDPFEETE